jgi:hypothetical protein
MMRLFFSHSLTTYDTPIEDKCLSLLRSKYPDCHIINPKYVQITEPINKPQDFRRVMEDYILPIVRSCNILAWYKDDSYAPGVDMEIAEATRLGIPIIKLEL